MFSFGVQLFYFKKNKKQNRETDLVNTLGDEQGPKRRSKAGKISGRKKW